MEAIRTWEDDGGEGIFKKITPGCLLLGEKMRMRERKIWKLQRVPNIQRFKKV